MLLCQKVLESGLVCTQLSVLESCIFTLVVFWDCTEIREPSLFKGSSTVLREISLGQLEDCTYFCLLLVGALIKNSLSLKFCGD